MKRSKTALQLKREEIGLTQRQVAEAMEISERLYQAYEYDEKEPGTRRGILIGRRLGASTLDDLDELFPQQRRGKRGCVYS